MFITSPEIQDETAFNAKQDGAPLDGCRKNPFHFLYVGINGVTDTFGVNRIATKGLEHKKSIFFEGDGMMRKSAAGPDNHGF